MNMMHSAALHAYGRQNVAVQVESASPHRLILMLFDGAISACRLARAHLQNGATAEKGTAISKAIAIVQEGLRVSLDKEQGGELAANLDALYDYIGRQLLQANLRNDAAKLGEAVALLCGLRESWEQVDPARAAAPAPRPDRAAAVSYGQA